MSFVLGVELGLKVPTALLSLLEALLKLGNDVLGLLAVGEFLPATGLGGAELAATRD